MKNKHVWCFSSRSSFTHPGSSTDCNTGYMQDGKSEIKVTVCKALCVLVMITKCNISEVIIIH